MYHMNYLESRKSIELAAKAMSALAVQPTTEISAADTSACLLSSDNSNSHLSTHFPPLVDPEQPIDLTDNFQDLNFSPPPRKCDNCNSTDIEFDNSINRAVCMGCGGDLDNNISHILNQFNTLELVEYM